MGFIGGLFGSNSGLGYNPSGTSIVAPAGTLVQTGTNPNGTPIWGANPQSAINATNGVTNALGLQTALSGYNAPQNQQNVFNQQQALANQLQGLANGQGPNPALAQLRQTTGQNIAAQNALMAGQRGASSNVGLLARQAAQQGAATQQQAVGQGAQLRANQQLAGIGALQQQQGMLGNLSQGQVEQMIQNANVSGGLANQNFGINQGALADFNRSNVGMQSNLNNVSGSLAGNVANAQIGMIGQGINALGSAGILPFNKGGSVPQTKALQYLISKKMAGGGMAKKPVVGEMLASQGKMVPGKASVSGDSLKNDTVPAMLSPGEIVIPRTIAQSPDASEKAARFVAAVKARKHK